VLQQGFCNPFPTTFAAARDIEAGQPELWTFLEFEVPARHVDKLSQSAGRVDWPPFDRRRQSDGLWGALLPAWRSGQVASVLEPCVRLTTGRAGGMTA